MVLFALVNLNDDPPTYALHTAGIADYTHPFCSDGPSYFLCGFEVST
jgi:hypothetical protein